MTVYTGKVEVGQNIRTSLTQAVAEELRAPVGSIRLVMGDTDLTPYDMGTFGSRTTPRMAPQLRKASSVARELLIDLAAQQWGVAHEEILADEGKVLHPASKRTLSYGQLSKGQKLLKTIGDGVSAVPADQWKVSGQSIQKVDGRAMVTGQHKFTVDLRRPGMLFGKVLRPPTFQATLTSLDARQAEAMPGVTVVRDGNFVGIAAPSEQIASRAIASMQAEWDWPSQPSGREIFEYLKKNPSDKVRYGGRTPPPQGSIEQGLTEAEHKIERTYTVTYIAHAPLEPRAALAEWNGGKLTVWTGTQRPFGVRSELAEAFRISEDRVRVIMPDTGSGYGGKHTGETATEAARLAQAAGKPVKLVWTREEEFTWAYFRPAGVIDVTSGVKRDGTITAWEFDNYNSGTAAIETQYDIPHQKILFHGAQSPLRQGSYRALAGVANNFARETQIDEMAYVVKMDPLEFRLKNLKDARMRAVLEVTAKRFGWGERESAPGHGLGIAAGFDKGGYIVTCVEISVGRANGEVRILRAVSAFDCGAVVNPDHLRNQIDGSIIMGIGGALFEAIEFENGKILNPRFSLYRVPRFSDAPAVESILVDRKDLASAGAGEAPIICLAPAVGNAIFQATGVRLRSLPLAPNGLKV